MEPWLSWLVLSARQRARPWASASTAEPPSMMRISTPATRQSPAPQQFTTRAGSARMCSASTAAPQPLRPAPQRRCVDSHVLDMS